MLKAVLVDDEELIIQGMMVLIDWEKEGIDIAGVAYDGAEALDVIAKVKPDIVISDIRMSGMDGLEMILGMKKIVPDAKVMIMSGYRDFEYARKALERGASCYLLKPMLRKDLLEQLALVKAQISQQRNLKQDSLENLLRKYVSRENEGIQPDAEILKSFAWKSLQAFVYSGAREGFDELLRDSCEKLVSVEDGVSVCVFALDGRQSVCVLLSKRDYALTLAYEERILSAFALAEKECGPVQCGVGRIKAFPSEIWEAIEEARQAFDELFFQPGKEVSHWNGAIAERNSNFIPLKVEKEFLDAMILFDEAKAREKVDELLSALVTNHQLKKSVITLSGNMIRRSALALDVPFSMVATLSETENAMDIDAVREACLSSVHQVLSLAIKDQRGTSGSLIEEIQSFIASHYASVTRQMIADEFLLNPSYVSQLFTHSLGKTFNEYLTLVRMGEARRLLLSSKSNLQVIAEKVGYTSSTHFIRTFGKTYGMSPQEYRVEYARTEEAE